MPDTNDRSSEMAGNSGSIQIPQSPSDGKEHKEMRWERSVRRKCDSVLQEWNACHNLFEKEVSRQCQNSSGSSRMLKSLGKAIKRLNFEELDDPITEEVQSREVHALPRDPALMSEDELVKSWRFMQRAPPESSSKSRKRSHGESSSQAKCREDPMFSYEEVLTLQKALNAERDALQRLHMELEQERCASKTAADEAMSMILRLQDEKAAALMEARQYKRVAEEREIHHQEAIALLKEALLSKELELLTLQEHINFYRERFLRLESGSGKDQYNYLEGETSKDQILLLENQETTPTSCTGHKYWHDNNIQVGAYVDYGHIGECAEGRPQGGSFDEVEHNVSGYPLPPEPYHDMDERLNTGDDEPSRSPEDISASILSRMKRLEERLEYIQQCQVVENDEMNAVSGDTSFLQQLHAIQNAFSSRQQWTMETQDRKMKSPACARSMEHPVNDNHTDVYEDVNCVYSEDIRKFDKKSYNEQLETETLMQRQRVELRTEKTDALDECSDDALDGVHDVYEVQDVAKESNVESLSEFVNKTMEGANRAVDSTTERSLQETGEVSTEGSCDAGLCKSRSQNQDAYDDLSSRMSSLHMKNALANATDEHVEQLKVRLQALEAERMFMKEAIQSLRKENMELKLLQEIAQQLRELKGDVGRTGQQEQSQFLKYLKGFLTFTGFQDSSDAVESRSSSSHEVHCDERDSSGLLHLLSFNKCSDTTKVGFVTRTRKVKLNTTV